MSESDKKYNEPISEDSAKDGTVEAFEDFEMAGENTEEIPDVTVETDDFTENTDTPVEELIEESADDASDEAGPEEIADDASDEAGPEEIADDASDEAEPEEIADDASDEAEPEEIADGASDEAEPEETADDASDEGEPEETADDASDEAEPEETADDASDEGEPEEIADDASDEAEPEEIADDGASDEAEAVEEIADDASDEAEPEEIADDTSDEAEPEEIADDTSDEAEAAEEYIDNETEAFLSLENAISKAEQNNSSDDEGLSYDENFELTDDGLIESEEAGETDEIDGEEEVDEEEVDEDDYLDYDDGPRRKKIVSGKAAVITMLVTCFVTIGLIAGAFWLGVTMQRDTGVSVVSFADRFNACDTNDFSLGQMIGVDTVSFSDKECTFSQQDIKDLKSGKTVTKFDDLVNIKANTRFGKIVSMDVTFNEGIDELSNPSVNCLLLLGSALSGMFDGIDSGNMAFLFSYNASVINCIKWPDKGDNVYYYQTNGIVIYTDHSKRIETGKDSDLQVHVENADANYIHMNRLDFSWLPFDFSSDSKNNGKTQAETDTTIVSSSDKVSATDN